MTRTALRPRTLRLAAMVALIVGGLTPVASAHQDAPLSVAPDGEVSGLPRRYGRAYVRIDRTRKPPAVTVGIGSNVTRLPPCLAKLFEGLTASDLEASASWYHEQSVLPHYLALHNGGDFSRSLWIARDIGLARLALERAGETDKWELAAHGRDAE